MLWVQSSTLSFNVLSSKDPIGNTKFGVLSSLSSPLESECFEVESFRISCLFAVLVVASLARSNRDGFSFFDERSDCLRSVQSEWWLLK